MSSGRNKKRKHCESTSIAGHVASVTPSLSVQPLTPPCPSADPYERAGSHSFIESRNLVVNDGQFNHVRGHQASLVINVNHSSENVSRNASDSPSGSPPSDETDHINPTPSSDQSTQLNHERSQVSSQNQEITLQKSNDIYERHLSLKGRGFPLWIPDPNQVLHTDYRRTGVRIGDVGIITHSGGFSFLFNICLGHNDPVNPRMLPEHFSPISPPIEATDIEKFLVFKNGSHIASASIQRLQTSTAISGIVFESSASEGAILTMPRGARSEDLGNFARFRDYAAANVADWYKFVNGPRGREAKNGDVRLVVGFDKTTSWGIATFANQTQQNHCRLKFGPSEGAGLMTPAASYGWEYSGVAEVRAGPDSEENDELKRDSDPPDAQFENQCLFVRTLNVTLTDDVWTDIHSSLGSVHVKSLSDSSRPHSTNPGTDGSSNSLPSQGEQSGTQRTASGLRDCDMAPNDNPSMFISGPLQSLTAHPSKFLNDVLLAKVSTAKMVITHDNDWSSVITQYDTLPDPHSFIENILASRNVCEENGVVFLQPKEVPNEISEGSASGDCVQVHEAIMVDLAGTETQFNKDNLHVFIAFIFSLQLSQYKNAFPALPRFFLIDGARDLISFNISHYSEGLESQKLPEMSTSSFFPMTHDTVKEMSELFLGVGLLEDAQNPLCYDFDEKTVYRFTLLGLHSLNCFLHENSYLQNFLKSSLGVIPTQTTALPLSVIVSMGVQYFMQAGLMEDAQDILSTTFNDGKVYQFTDTYFASAVNFPSTRHAEEDNGGIALPHSSRKNKNVTVPPSPPCVGDALSTSHPFDHYQQAHFPSTADVNPEEEPMLYDDEARDVSMDLSDDGGVGVGVGANDIRNAGGVINVGGSTSIEGLVGSGGGNTSDSLGFLPLVPALESGGNSGLAALAVPKKSSSVKSDRPPQAPGGLGMMGQSKMTLATGVRQKQKRYTYRSCDACIERKKKCDGIKPVCQSCQRRQNQCTWTARKPRTGSYFLAMHKQAENLRKRVAEFRQYADHLESLVQDCQQYHQQHQGIDFRASRPSDSDGLLDLLEPEFDYGPVEENDLVGMPICSHPQSIQPGPISHPSWFPALSGSPENTYVLLVEGVESTSDYNPAFDWSRHLPSDVPLDRRSHDKALDLLFKFLTSWCLRIVPALFLRDMYRALSVPATETTPKTPHYSPMLHNALVALALAFLDEPKFSDLKSQQYFANVAKTFIEAECQKPNLSVVHALSILASFHSAQGDQTLGHMYFGMSVHMSQALGLNIDCSEWVKLGLMDEADRLDRHWANWTTFTQDVCWSLYVGRDFCAAVPIDSGALPISHIDPDFDKMSWFYPPAGIAPQPNNLTKTFEATCRLLMIARRIMDVANRLNEARSRPLVLDPLIIDIDMQLNKWKDSLTPELEITAKLLPTATPHKLMLHLTYWWLFILLHRPFFYRKSRPTQSTDPEIDHVKLCHRAAEHIMELLLTWRNLYTLRYCPITLIQIVFSAGTVYLLTAVQASSGIRIAQTQLRHSLDQEALVSRHLQEIGLSWKSAMNISGILRSLTQEQVKPLLGKRRMPVTVGLQIPGDFGEGEEDSDSSPSNSSSKSSHTRKRQVTYPSPISFGSNQSSFSINFQPSSSQPSKNHYLDGYLGMSGGQTLSEMPFAGFFSEGDILSPYFPYSPQGLIGSGFLNHESSSSSLDERVPSSSCGDRQYFMGPVFGS